MTVSTFIRMSKEGTGKYRTSMVNRLVDSEGNILKDQRHMKGTCRTVVLG